MDTDGALAVWEALAPAPAAPDLPPADVLSGDWPGVADPEALRDQLADWLAQYANAGTRRTYAYALGLPVAWVDLDRRCSPRGAPSRPHPAARAPRPAAPPRLVPLVRRPRPRPPRRDRARGQGLAARPRRRRREPPHPPADALHPLGALRPPHRDRRGRRQPRRAAPGPPRPVQHRPRRLADGPAHRRPARALLLAAGGLAAHPRPAAAPPLRHPRRRVRRPAHPRPADLRARRARPRRPVPQRRRRRAARARQGRAPPRGLRHRPRPRRRRRPSTWPSATASPGAATPARRGPHRGGREPRSSPPATAAAARGPTSTRCCAASPRTPGPSSTASRTGSTRTPLRHAYVTIALEQDARIHHVQADVGHASIATTQHYDRGLRTRATTAADLVAAAIAAAGATAGRSESGPMLSDDEQVSVPSLTGSAVRTTTRGAVPDRFMTRRR